MKVRARALDLSDSAMFEPLLDAASNAETLVNNGGAIPGGDLQAVKEARWRVGWDGLVFGYIKLCRAFYAAMQKKGDGVIVNVAGVAADRLDTNYIAGAAGDASLNACSRALGSNSFKDGIRVLAISPGAVETEGLVNLMKTKAEN